jgi:hypothetical protein
MAGTRGVLMPADHGRIDPDRPLQAVVQIASGRLGLLHLFKQSRCTGWLGTRLTRPQPLALLSGNLDV